MRRWKTDWTAVVVMGLALLSLLLLRWESDDLPTEDTFRQVAQLAILVVIVLASSVGWYLRRRSHLSDGEPAGPTAYPSGGRARSIARVLLLEAGVYVLATGLGTIAFLIYMSRNPLPSFARSEAFEARYATQLHLLEGLAQGETVPDVTVNRHPLDVEAISGLREVVSAEIDIGHWVVRRLYHGHSEIVGWQSLADPLNSEGDLPTITVISISESSGAKVRAIHYTRSFRNPADKVAKITLDIDYDILRSIARHGH